MCEWTNLGLSEWFHSKVTQSHGKVIPRSSRMSAKCRENILSVILTGTLFFIQYMQNGLTRIMSIKKDLKPHNQAKIIKKSVILFLLLNMTIQCKHVHRLELQFFIYFCAAHLPVLKMRYRDEISVFLISDMHVRNKKYGNFVSISLLTGQCATQKLKTFAVLVFEHVRILWSYWEAKIKLPIFCDFSLIVSLYFPFSEMGCHPVKVTNIKCLRRWPNSDPTQWQSLAFSGL